MLRGKKHKRNGWPKKIRKFSFFLHQLRMWKGSCYTQTNIRMITDSYTVKFHPSFWNFSVPIMLLKWTEQPFNLYIITKRHRHLIQCIVRRQTSEAMTVPQNFWLANKVHSVVCCYCLISANLLLHLIKKT